MPETLPVRCKKCRTTLFSHPECPLLDIHGKEMIEGDEGKACPNQENDYLWFLDAEKSPSWILSSIEEVGWTKGKLSCPSCHSRVGSFDFVSGLKCPCNSHTLPPLHVVRAKVDAFISSSPLKYSK